MKEMCVIFCIVVCLILCVPVAIAMWLLAFDEIREYRKRKKLLKRLKSKQ